MWLHKVRPCSLSFSFPENLSILGLDYGFRSLGAFTSQSLLVSKQSPCLVTFQILVYLDIDTWTRKYFIYFFKEELVVQIFFFAALIILWNVL